VTLEYAPLAALLDPVLMGLWIMLGWKVHPTSSMFSFSYFFSRMRCSYSLLLRRRTSATSSPVLFYYAIRIEFESSFGYY
jgi:hypothetical protein